MNDKQIKFALSLAKHKRFSTVAEKYYVTSSTVSKQVSMLEEEIGFDLFIRNRHGVSLSKEGEMLIPVIKEGWDNYLKKLDEISKIKSGINTLYIGFQESFDSNPDLIRSVSEIRKAFPDTDVSVSSFSYKELVDMVSAGKADILFCPKECISTDAFLQYPLWTKPNALMVPANHPLATKESIKDYDFSNEKFMILYVGPTDKKTIAEKIKKEFGVEDKNILLFDNIENFYSNLETLGGLTVLPMLDMYLNDSRFRFISLDKNVWSDCTVVAAWGRDNDKPALLEFVNILKKHFPGN